MLLHVFHYFSLIFQCLRDVFHYFLNIIFWVVFFAIYMSILRIFENASNILSFSGFRTK